MNFRQRIFKAFVENDWVHLGPRSERIVGALSVPVAVVTSGVVSYNIDKDMPVLGRWVVSTAAGLTIGGLSCLIFATPTVVIGTAVAVPVLTVPVYAGIKAKEYFK